MKVSEKLIGKICKNSDGRDGLVTCIKGDEVRGIGLDGKGNWSSNNPILNKTPYEDYDIAICKSGKIGIVKYKSNKNYSAYGVGIDGKSWRSSDPEYVDINYGFSLVRNILNS